MNHAFVPMGNWSQLRCPVCSRVFCCPKHRADHTRRDHAAAVIRRRLRPIKPTVAAPRPAATAVNGRKRDRAWTPVGPADPIAATPLRPRVLLKATRPSLSSAVLERLRPVAESSPAVPCTPLFTTATESADQPMMDVTPDDRRRAAGQTPDHTPSIYQTPSMQTPVPGLSADVRKRVSFGNEPTPKGFFWSKVARRFRMILRPGKPKTNEDVASPSTANMVKYYDNIKSRRPINDIVCLTPVMARPPLEAIRMAHEAAVKITSKTSTGDQKS